MKSAVALIITLLALTACGADGVPIRPSLDLGVSITPNGIKPTASASASAGIVDISIGK